MKKPTLFNASLEESMNLVTDKYIQTAMEDINEKGYKRKILGFFTILLFTWLFYVLTVMLDKEGIMFFFVKPSIVSGILFILSIVPVFSYLRDVTKIRNKRILSYYYYYKNFFS